MCQQKTVYRCKHSSYRKIRCSAKKAQRSNCFFMLPQQPCAITVTSQPSSQLCSNCLRKSREMWAVEPAEQQRDEGASTRYDAIAPGFYAQLPQKPQAARLRLESEPLDTTIPSGNRKSTAGQAVPLGVDLSSVAADAFHFVQAMPVQQPSHLIPHEEDTSSVSPVSSGFVDARCVSPQTSVENLRAEAHRRVVDGLGNFF